MINTIIWNIRGVESKGAFDRLIKLVRIHKVSFVALLEPFVHSSNNYNLDHYKRKLGLQHAIANCNGKIWCFWNGDYTCNAISNHKQELTLSIQHAMVKDTHWVTIVYAKTKARRRKKLWHHLEQVKDSIHGPWSIFGDFNTIMQASEKKGGRPHRLRKRRDFIRCMDNCGVVDAGYSGNDFTWSNNRKKRKRISERLDRVFYNDEWSEYFPIVTVRHLPRTGSDHNMLLMQCNIDEPPAIKYFKFLNFWVQQPGFQSLVKSIWEEDIIGNAMWVLQ